MKSGEKREEEVHVKEQEKLVHPKATIFDSSRMKRDEKSEKKKRNQDKINEEDENQKQSKCLC